MVLIRISLASIGIAFAIKRMPVRKNVLLMVLKQELV